jgi:hypothetical protein
MMNVIMVSVIMLNVVMLCDVYQSVAAPKNPHKLKLVLIKC